MAQNVMIFLETADGAYCLLTDDQGKLTPSAMGEVRAGEAPQAAAARLLKEHIGVDAVPPALQLKGTFECGGQDYDLFITHYTVAMGAFSLSEEYTDDTWLDRGELQEVPPEQFSPPLLTALHYL